MAFILPKPPSFGQSLASGLGTGLESLAQQKLQQIQQRNLAQSLGQFVPQQQAQALSQLPENLQQTALKDLLQAPQQQAFAQALGIGNISAESQPAIQGALAETSPSALSAASPRLNERQALEIAKLRQAEGKQSSKERSEAFKQTQKLREEIINTGRQARRNLDDLNRLEELEKEGLPSAGYQEFLKRSGLDIPALRSGAGQEFEKIAANFISNARSVFGARVTNFELESFLKTIPSLSQTPAGRARVIANLKNINRLNALSSKAMKDIISKNKGIPPLDLYEKIDDRIASKSEKLARKFRKDLEKPLPASEPSKLSTATGAIAGTVAPYIPGVVGGAALGRYLGPYGALLGGLGGGLATGAKQLYHFLSPE